MSDETQAAVEAARGWLEAFPTRAAALERAVRADERARYEQWLARALTYYRDVVCDGGAFLEESVPLFEEEARQVLAALEGGSE